MKQKSKQTKEKLLESFKSGKKISISVMCVIGILHVIFGVDILLAIMSIPYTDIKKTILGCIILRWCNIPKYQSRTYRL